MALDKKAFSEEMDIVKDEAEHGQDYYCRDDMSYFQKLNALVLFLSTRRYVIISGNKIYPKFHFHPYKPPGKWVDVFLKSLAVFFLIGAFSHGDNATAGFMVTFIIGITWVYAIKPYMELKREKRQKEAREKGIILSDAPFGITISWKKGIIIYSVAVVTIMLVFSVLGEAEMGMWVVGLTSLVIVVHFALNKFLSLFGVK